MNEYRRRLRDEPAAIANLHFTYMLALCAVSAARECVLGSVWLDSRPGVAHAARYKMACAVEPNDNTYMFSSEDGLNFTRMFDGPSINGSDTPVTCMHDNTLGRYVCYVRADYFNSFGKDARSLIDHSSESQQ